MTDQDFQLFKADMQKLRTLLQDLIRIKTNFDLRMVEMSEQAAALTPEQKAEADRLMAAIEATVQTIPD